MIWCCTFAVLPVRAQTPGPWISANFIYIAPTTAQMIGDGFQPGAPLWLDMTDPLGVVTTTPLFADNVGRIRVDVAVDQPGIYQGQVRDGAGEILSKGEMFVGVD
jgi:hypothetical protein